MKLNKNTEKRTDITVLPIVPGTVILSAVMLLAFLLLLVILNLNGMIDLPNWAERIIGTAEAGENETDSFGEAFLSSLSGTQQTIDNDILYVETDSESLLSLLQSTTPAASYYHTCKIARTNVNGDTVIRQVFRIVSGEREHAEVLFHGQLETAVTLDAESVAITKQGQTRTFQRNANSVFTAESETGFPSFARMIRMLEETEAGKYTLSLSSAQNAACIRAEFTDTASGTREVFDVIPDYGIIIAAASYLPASDTPYYTLQTISLLTDISGFDESIFDMPES